MINFPSGVGIVSVFFQVLRQRNNLFKWLNSAKPWRQAVDAGSGRSQAGHQARAGGVAKGRLAVSVGEGRSAIRQSVHVGCLDLRMSLQRSDPVVEVVDRDEQNVRSVLSRFC